MERRLKIILITLLIILLAIISFAGLFVQNTKFMKNIVPEYQLGMDLQGYRTITLLISDEEETIYYDKDGNVVSSAQDDGTSKKVPINNEEDLTNENYKKARDLMKQRLEHLGISEYLIRLDEENGSVTVQIPEDNITDTASQFLYTRGNFELKDADTGEVLLDSSNLKEVTMGYSTLSSGTAVYLSFEFNKDSVEKLREISTTYVSSTDEDGEETEKEVTLSIDGSTLLTTTFDEEITNGVIPINLGAATDSSTLSSYMGQARNIALLVNDGPLPLEYTIDQNRYIKSDITLDSAMVPAIILAVALVIGFIVLIIKYKKLGLFAIISYIGYMAILLLAVRLFNLVVTLEGICGIVIAMVLNYILLVYLLHSLKHTEKDLAQYKIAYNKAIISMALVLIPTLIIGIVLCFAAWNPAYSFGTIIFWAVFIMAIYNISITRILFLNSIKK